MPDTHRCVLHQRQGKRKKERDPAAGPQPPTSNPSRTLFTNLGEETRRGRSEVDSVGRATTSTCRDGSSRPRVWSRGSATQSSSGRTAGPASVTLARPDERAALLSMKGYDILFPNPRGSYGQGEAFTQANVKDFGYGDPP
jgi:dipeptidyl aminopeptidase/acylaminoacyl peptidase